MQVLPGSCISLSLKLMHQACSSPPQSAASGSSSISSSAAVPKSAADAAALPALEPFTPVSAEEVAGCNVLTFSPQLARPLPPQMVSAAHNANGALTCTVALHLPGSDRGQPLVTCSGGSIKDEQLTWNESRRVYLGPPAVQALKVTDTLQHPHQSSLLLHLLFAADHVQHCAALPG